MSDTQQTALLSDPTTATGFVYGAGMGMQILNEMVSEIAPTDIPVLIAGESGTGKDAYARLIHRLSLRQATQLCKINCSLFDPALLETHLSASQQKASSTERPGTLYLDNVQELDSASQRVLLSLLPDDEFPASLQETFPRLISSTSINLELEVEEGRFRRELYFRLNGACLLLPPLRNRIEDVPAFAEYFLNKYSRALKKNASSLSDETIRALSDWRWPGNIRELENLARKMAVFGDSQVVLKELKVARAVQPGPTAVARGTSLKLAARAASEKAERELILRALAATRWNRKQAARELQISYKSLLYKIKRIGISNGKREN